MSREWCPTPIAVPGAVDHGVAAPGERPTPQWNLDGGIHEIPLPPPVAGRLWLCAQPSERVTWSPIPDLHAPDREQFEPVLADIGRAGTTAVAVLVSMGVSLDDALAQLELVRDLSGHLYDGPAPGSEGWTHVSRRRVSERSWRPAATTRGASG